MKNGMKTLLGDIIKTGELHLNVITYKSHPK